MSDVLFIHPTNHIHPRVIPVGSIAAANGIAAEVLGRYASEVTAEEIEDARVILLDVHWFLPMGILGGLIEAIRRINQEASLIIGGLAAAFYGADFRERFAVDYVVGGHAETALPQLVQSLLDDQEPGELPRVWREGHDVSPIKRPSQEQFDTLDWITLDWFPTYARYARSLHEGARFDPATPQMDAWPLLPVTRGCVRECGFCYGAYQDRVFGPGVRARSPEALLRDLRQLEADPAVRFVSLLFADAVFLKRYLDPLEGLEVELDAYLYFCGSLTPEELDRARSVFSGQVGFSIIQPADLTPLKRDDSPARQEEDFEVMLTHLESLDDSGAVVLFVDEASPALERAHARAGNILKATGEDWPVIRPDEGALSESVSVTDQLDQVTDHARLTSHLHLLRSLVPALTQSFKMNDVFRYEPGALVDRELEALPKRIAHLYMHGIFEQRQYAIGEVTLTWVVCDEVPEEGVDWLSPGHGEGATVEWRHDLNGPVWVGELKVPQGGPWGVSLLPRMEVPGDDPIEIQDWDRARVPTLTVPPGPPRTVRLGGGVQERGIELWIEDRGRRRDWLLEPARVTQSDDPPDAITALVEGLPERPPWPDSHNTRDLMERLRGAGWVLEACQVHPHHLAFRTGPPGTSETIAIALFPARNPEPFLSRGDLALAYGDLPDAMTGERLAEALFEALEDRP
jgi:hypothetical protein